MLWSLWDMLQSYFPIYQIALSLQSLRTTALLLKNPVQTLALSTEVERFNQYFPDDRDWTVKLGLLGRFGALRHRHLRS
jgi:hypothetical protein